MSAVRTKIIETLKKLKKESKSIDRKFGPIVEYFEKILFNEHQDFKYTDDDANLILKGDSDEKNMDIGNLKIKFI
jgi:uncharacterized protein YqkB